MKRELSPYYPVFLKVSGKRCVVVGGGEVARRKVEMLLDHGASIEVISPDLCPELDHLAETGEIAARRRHYRTGDLRGASIVIVATDDHNINLEVVREANRTGIPVNVVDDPGNSDFIVPSCLRRGDITVAVSTSGRSPALARKIRTRLEKDLEEEYAALALLADEVRREVKRQGIKVNGDDWQKAMDLDLLIGLLKKGDSGQARTLLLDNLKARQR